MAVYRFHIRAGPFYWVFTMLGLTHHHPFMVPLVTTSRWSAMAKTSGIVNIHGKDYATVAYRLTCFRQLHPDGIIVTTLQKDDDGVIVMKSEIWLDRSDGLPIATGWAEEVRGSSNINKTSALENCETSAVGRALGFAGFGSAEQIASADEVEVAIARQAEECATARQTARVMAEKKITEKQRKALEAYIDTCDDGDIKLRKVLEYYKIDNLSEMAKEDAATALTKLEITV